jgi:hypothetical protein
LLRSIRYAIAKKIWCNFWREIFLV